MVLTVAQATEKRLAQMQDEIDDLAEQIDEFLITGEDAGFDVGTISSFVRDHLTDVYSKAGWKVRWEVGKADESLLYIEAAA